METSVFDLSELLNKRVDQPQAGRQGFVADDSVSGLVSEVNEKEKEGRISRPDLLTLKDNENPSAAILSNETQGRILPESESGRTSTTEAPAFFGSSEGKGPQYTLQEEKAHHRFIIYELASGKTPGEIAKEHGFTPAMVYYVEKQPWAKKEVARLLQQHGGDRVEQVLKGAVLDSANLLISTVRDTSCDIKVRSQNAKEILDRIYGRSQQIVNHRNVDPSDISDSDLAKLATSGTGGQ